MNVAHVTVKKKQVCWFWMNSYCQQQQSCHYQHPNQQECRFQLNCNEWPDCKFKHSENGNVWCKFQQKCQNQSCRYKHQETMNKPCHFQEKCQNLQCNFQHFVGNPQNSFLGGRPTFYPPHPREFPPLSQQQVWRPWF